MSCSWVVALAPLGCTVADAPGQAASTWIDSVAANLASVMKSLMSFWIKAPDPDLASGPGSVIAQVQDITGPIIAFSVIVGIIVAAMKLIRASSDTHGDLDSLIRGLLLIVAVSVAGAGVVELLESAFSQLAQYILDKGFNGHDVGQTLLKLFSDPSGGGGVSAVIFGILGIIVSAIQWAIMIFRGAILALLVGILPVAAAGALTDGGMQSFKKVCGWISAFILYRATAAVIYATAFLMLGSGSSSGIMFGMILVILSILALPALLRLMPAGAAAMGGGGGSGALGAVAGAVATGSMLLAGRGSSGAAAAASSPTGSQTPGLKTAAGQGGGPGSARHSGSQGSAGTAGSAGRQGGGGSAGGPSGGSTTGGSGGRPMLVGVGGSHGAASAAVASRAGAAAAPSGSTPGGAAQSGAAQSDAGQGDAGPSGGSPGSGSGSADRSGGAGRAAVHGGSAVAPGGGSSTSGGGGSRVASAVRAAQVGQAVKGAGDAVGDAATGSEPGGNG